MPSDDDVVQERPLGGLGDDHRRRRPRRIEGATLVDDVAVGEGSDRVRGETGIVTVGEQVVGAVERHEALRVASRLEDLRGVVDRDGVVDRRVHHQQRPLHGRHPIGDHVIAQVVDELLADPERPTGQLHLGGAGRGDLVERRLEVADDVRRARRCADRDDRTNLGDVGGHGEHGGTAERVPDQHLRGSMLATQPIGGGNQIVGVRREVGVLELALAHPQPREVEPQHPEAQIGERVGDARRRSDVLAAGEAVGEQRERPRRAGRQIESGGELGLLTPRKGHSFDACGHGSTVPRLRSHRMSDDSMPSS